MKINNEKWHFPLASLQSSKLIKNCLYSEMQIDQAMEWQWIYAKQLACFSVANLNSLCDVIADNTKRIWILLKKKIDRNYASMYTETHDALSN